MDLNDKNLILPRYILVNDGLTGGYLVVDGETWTPVYDFNDQFLTPESAPMVTPRTAEPGGGTGTIVDTDNKASIVAGKLNLFPHSTPAFGNPGIWMGVQTRASGLILMSSMQLGELHSFQLGFDSGTSGLIAASSFFGNVAGVNMRLGVGTQIALTDLVIDTDYYFAQILRDTGSFFIIKGGVYTEWTLMWVVDVETHINVYGALVEGNGASASPILADFIRSIQLIAPWNTDYGIATDRLAGARNAGDTFVHEADCLIEFEVTTLGSNDGLNVHFRQQDSLNYWRINIKAVGSIYLREVVDGIVTLRANTGAGVVSDGTRVVAIVDNETIKIYHNNVLGITYALAANFKFETDGELFSEGAGGSVSDIITWPRKIAGSASSILSMVANS